MINGWGQFDQDYYRNGRAPLRENIQCMGMYYLFVFVVGMNECDDFVFRVLREAFISLQ
ncbi:MAG: hypothetical protein ACI8RD_001466 [Bacillariaceae sp.]|jgi:hypothetical protein